MAETETVGAVGASMRPVCADVLAELGDGDPDLVVMAADGHAWASTFARRHPRRFIDVGIAEANLVGVASGLARQGRRVVVGTMAPFLVRRAAEQIRLDVCRAGLNVTMIGVGGGLGYGALGATHHVAEDLGVMATMPHIRVYSPADIHDAAWSVREAVLRPGPAYVRLGARNAATVYRAGEPFSADRPRRFGEPGHALVVATGATVVEAVRAARRASAAGLRTEVLALTVVHPFPAEQVLHAAMAAGTVVTVEEHRACGGLGAATALALAGRWHGRFTVLAVDGAPAPATDQAGLFRFYGIEAGAITHALLDGDTRAE
jgi:transketolase